MKEVKLNIFGQNFTIAPKGFISTVYKISEDVVELSQTYQSGMIFKMPLNVKVKCDKSADEFISEFERQNAQLVQQEQELSLNKKNENN